MNPATIYHRPLSEFAFATDATHYVFRLRTGKGEAQSCRFFYADRAAMAPELDFACLPMKKIREDRYFDWYEVRLKTKLERIAYYFELSDGTETLCYFGDCYEMAGTPTRADFFQLPFNHRADRLSVPEWTKDAVVYNIFPDSFADGFRTLSGGSDGKTGLGGTIRGIAENLDYIASMGFNCIYLNPIFAAESYHRYDTLDYYQVDPHMGSKEDVRALVEKAHSLGIRVLLDGVFNHCGSFNKWMDRERIYEGEKDYEPGAYVSADSPYRSYFRFFKEGPENWPYNANYDGWWGHDTLPKLNYEDSVKLENYILYIGRKWVSPPYNVDGWRLDVAADLGRSNEYNHEFWQKFRRAVKDANPNALILAEHYGDPSDWLKGDEWDTVMNYDAFMEPVTWFLTGMEKHSDEAREELLGNIDNFIGSMAHHMSNMLTPSLQVAMNELSNHDHSRFLTRTNHMVGRVEHLRFTFFAQSQLVDDLLSCGQLDFHVNVHLRPPPPRDTAPRARTSVPPS